jgi:hypothetical protein
MKLIDKNRQLSSPGGPVAKSPFITIMKVEDLASTPQPNAKGVLLEGLYEMKQGKEPFKIYNTGSFQNFGFETDGDEDAASIQKTLTARFPGDGLEIREFIGGQMDIEVIAVFGGGCGQTQKSVIGSTCAPIKMRSNFTMDNDTTHYELTFSNMSNDNLMPGLFGGPDPVANVFVADAADLEFLVANGALVKLPSSATGEAVGVTDIDFPSGSFVSVIGGGGTDPAVISDATGTAAKFVLKDGTSFIGLENARITFEVFIAGTDTFLIERSRS